MIFMSIRGFYTTVIDIKIEFETNKHETVSWWAEDIKRHGTPPPPQKKKKKKNPNKTTTNKQKHTQKTQKTTTTKQHKNNNKQTKTKQQEQKKKKKKKKNRPQGQLVFNELFSHMTYKSDFGGRKSSNYG